MLVLWRARRGPSHPPNISSLSCRALRSGKARPVSLGFVRSILLLGACSCGAHLDWLIVVLDAKLRSLWRFLLRHTPMFSKSCLGPVSESQCKELWCRHFSPPGRKYKPIRVSKGENLWVPRCANSGDCHKIHQFVYTYFWTGHRCRRVLPCIC